MHVFEQEVSVEHDPNREEEATGACDEEIEGRVEGKEDADDEGDDEYRGADGEVGCEGGDVVLCLREEKYRERLD